MVWYSLLLLKVLLIPSQSISHFSCWIVDSSNDILPSFWQIWVFTWLEFPSFTSSHLFSWSLLLCLWHDIKQGTKNAYKLHYQCQCQCQSLIYILPNHEALLLHVACLMARKLFYRFKYFPYKKCQNSMYTGVSSNLFARGIHNSEKAFMEVFQYLL